MKKKMQMQAVDIGFANWLGTEFANWLDAGAGNCRRSAG